MAGTAISGRLNWIVAEVVGVRTETPRARTLVLHVPGWPGHRAGQHVDIRLTAEDGYQAERSYSIASTPGSPTVELTVDRVPTGEVSPYLVDEVRVGDRFELRGPIGGYFTWMPDDGGPLLLIAGGSGIVPLMAITRYRTMIGNDTPIRLVTSFRTVIDSIYRPEILGLANADQTMEHVETLTRAWPPQWAGYRRRVDADMLADVAWEPAVQARTFVCGPTPFVESVASALVLLGHDPIRIKTERFGPTGG
jgi:ferredoxin-NADP reductase